MSLTLPSNPTRTNCDAGTDDPKQALLTDLYNHIGMSIDFLAAMGNLATKQYGNGLAVESQSAGTADKVHVAIATLSKSAAYTAVAADRGKLIDATTGTWALSLTAAATLGDGWFTYVRNSGSGIITIDPDTTELIDGASTITLAAGESCGIQCTGAAFRSIGKTVSGGGISGETTYNTNTTLSISTDHTKLIRCTVASVVYTFPAATGNEGKYWWIQNATATDTAVRLVANGAESLGGATGATIYIPAYTTIGFVSDGANWLVFDYSGKTIWTFTANGTWYCPPGKTAGVGTVVGGGSSGCHAGDNGNAGSTTSIGSLLTAPGGTPADTDGATYNSPASPNGTLGYVGDATALNNLYAGAGLYGVGGFYDLTALVLRAATGYGSGGASAKSLNYARGKGGARRIKESITPLPGTAYTITVGAGGTSTGANSGAGTAGIAIVELN